MHIARVRIATSAAAAGTVMFPKGSDGYVPGMEDGDVTGVIPGGSAVTFPIVPGTVGRQCPSDLLHQQRTGGRLPLRTASTAQQVARARPQARRGVRGVGQLALLERQAAASNALGEAGAQTLQLGNALIDPS